MPVSRIRRQLPQIDMAAMSDVAFLLLTFFMLTGRFRDVSILVEADLPKATTQYVCGMTECEDLTVTIKQGKVFIGFSSKALQQQTLRAMAVKYQLSFSPDELDRFTRLGNFGDSLSKMKGFIASRGKPDAPQFLKGIPIDDTKNNQFFSWVEQARIVYEKQTGKQLRVIIAGDQAEEYPLIKRVIANLQRQDINKFSLMSILKSKDA